jgi:type II restriction enzyme
VPSFFFAESAIERRKPLAPTARRAGWVGCNILLTAIASEGKIRVVCDGRAESAACVRRRYAAARPLAALPPSIRGWALDVLRVVEQIASPGFLLSDVYESAPHLQRLHPANRHVKEKIRQQLQVLRDMKLITFDGKGRYHLNKQM